MGIKKPKTPLTESEQAELLKLIASAQSLIKKGRSRQASPTIARIIEIVEVRLFRFCVYLCNNQDLARDICQDTLIKVFEAIAKLDDPKRFLPWTFQIARNEFLMHVRLLSNKPKSELKEDTLVDFKNDQAEIMTIRESLGKLDPEDRMVIVLADVEEYSYAEASEIIGISENAFRSRLHRARAQLMELFEGKSKTK